MSSHKVKQCRLSYRGRDFHFVSYEGHPANERRGESAMPAMWYLMGPAKRWPVMEHNPDQPDDEVEKSLLKWLGTQELVGPRRYASARRATAGTRRCAVLAWTSRTNSAGDRAAALGT